MRIYSESLVFERVHFRSMVCGDKLLSSLYNSYWGDYSRIPWLILYNGYTLIGLFDAHIIQHLFRKTSVNREGLICTDMAKSKDIVVINILYALEVYSGFNAIDLAFYLNYFSEKDDGFIYRLVF